MKTIQLILAPMAGINNAPFRTLCKEHGADIAYSEMISVAGIRYSKQQTLKFVKSVPADFPFFTQLFGSNPQDFALATNFLNNLPTSKNKLPFLRKPQGIDINFGCPVKKVLKQNAGCALMKNPNLAFEIIQAVCDNTNLPVSIKIRAGIEEYSALDFLEKVAILPWQTVIIHGRTFKQGFSGPINFELIKKIKILYPHKTVIANGGITDGTTAKEALTKTNADGLAIGRGALGKPWIFEEIKAALKNQPIKPKTQTEIKSVALAHLAKVKQYQGLNGLFEFRKHLGWYFKNFPNAKTFRQKLLCATSFEKIKTLLTSFPTD